MAGPRASCSCSYTCCCLELEVTGGPLLVPISQPSAPAEPRRLKGKTAEEEEARGVPEPQCGRRLAGVGVTGRLPAAQWR